jgi:hypothetical protein
MANASSASNKSPPQAIVAFRYAALPFRAGYTLCREIRKADRASWGEIGFLDYCSQLFIVFPAMLLAFTAVVDLCGGFQQPFVKPALASIFGRAPEPSAAPLSASPTIRLNCQPGKDSTTTFVCSQVPAP